MIAVNVTNLGSFWTTVFIYLVKSNEFDYNEWQRFDKDSGMTLDELRKRLDGIRLNDLAGMLRI